MYVRHVSNNRVVWVVHTMQCAQVYLYTATETDNNSSTIFGRVDMLDFAEGQRGAAIRPIHWFLLFLWSIYPAWVHDVTLWDWPSRDCGCMCLHHVRYRSCAPWFSPSNHKLETPYTFKYMCRHTWHLTYIMSAPVWDHHINHTVVIAQCPNLVVAWLRHICTHL